MNDTQLEFPPLLAPLLTQPTLAEPERGFRKGQRVEVISGPWRECLGTIAEPLDCDGRYGVELSGYGLMRFRPVCLARKE